MLMDAEKLLSYDFDDAVFRPYLRGDLLRIADVVGVSDAVRIACALPMAVLAFHSREHADQRLVAVIGDEAAKAIARTFATKYLIYLQIPAPSFSKRTARVFAAIDLMKKGVSFDEAVARTRAHKPKLATEIHRIGFVTAMTAKQPGLRSEAAKRARQMLSSGIPASKIAGLLGVSERTVRRWALSLGEMSPEGRSKCATKSKN